MRSRPEQVTFSPATGGTRDASSLHGDCPTEQVSIDHAKYFDASAVKPYVDVRLVLPDLVAPAPLIEVSGTPVQQT